jgi:uncharacterized protein involved in exopolysaccharide biosynthesis
MKATVQNLKALIKQIDLKISHLQETILAKDEEIMTLKSSYQELQNKHQKTLSQIKEYIKKIDYIKNSSHVDINNNN